MRFKKIFSLISAVAIMATTFTTVAMATNNTITFKVVPTEITESDWSTDAYKGQWKLNYKKTGKTAYHLAVLAKGMNWGTSTIQADAWSIVGRGLNSAYVKVSSTNNYVYKTDYRVGVYNQIMSGPAIAEPEDNNAPTKETQVSMISTTSVYPSADMLAELESQDYSMTVDENTEIQIAEFIMFVDPAKPVSLTFTGNVISTLFGDDGKPLANSAVQEDATPVTITIPTPTDSIDSISVAPTSAALKVGGTESAELEATVTATGDPDKTVAWAITSGSEYVELSATTGDKVTVSIKDKTITEQKTATIRATAGDKTADVTVTIDPKDPDPVLNFEYSNEIGTMHQEHADGAVWVVKVTGHTNQNAKCIFRHGGEVIGRELILPEVPTLRFDVILKTATRQAANLEVIVAE